MPRGGLAIVLLLALARSLSCIDSTLVSCEHVELTLHPRYAAFATDGPSVRTLPFSRELRLYAFDALDVWAPSPEEAQWILASASRARASERELLGEIDWHLTVVAIDRLPLDGSVELETFARTPATILVAWPTEPMLADALLRSIEKAARSLGHARAWPSSSSAFEAFASELAAHTLGRLFEHEYGHLAVLARHPEPVRAGGRYGTSLPDWLEESIAMAFTPRLPEAWLHSLTAVRQTRHSLAEFVASEHPGAYEEVAHSAPSPWLEIEARILMDGEPEPVARSGVAELYYPFSDVFAAFVVDAAGPAALRELLDATLVSGPAGTGWPDVPAGSRLPASVEQLESAFDAWLARQPTEPGEQGPPGMPPPGGGR